jgi:hypothetical protein
MGPNILLCVIAVGSFVLLHSFFGRATAIFFLMGTVFFAMIPAIALLCVGLVLVSLCLRKESHFGLKLALALVALTIPFAIGDKANNRLLAFREEVRKKYPMMSMAERLSYENTKQKKQAKTAPIVSAADKHFSPVILASLESGEKKNEKVRQEFSTNSHSRERQLKLAHDTASDEFIRRQSFGVGRMGNYHHRPRIRDDRIEPVNFDEPFAGLSAPQNGTVVRNARSRSLTESDSSNLKQVHQIGLMDFVNRERFGYFESRDRVAGFTPHTFTKMPAKTADVRILRLELVSLLRFEESCVYVATTLPNMEHLQGVSTRPVNSFEIEALEKLRFDEDIVIEERPDEIVMVGSLRASSICMTCHSVERGDLLGAFSYSISLGDSETPPVSNQGAKDGKATQPVSNHDARDGKTTQPVSNHDARDGKATQPVSTSQKETVE